MSYVNLTEEQIDRIKWHMADPNGHVDDEDQEILDVLTPSAEASERQQKIVQMAVDQHNDPGSVEIVEDPNLARISEGDENGAYVAAWVWVDFAGTEFDKQTEEEDAND